MQHGSVISNGRLKCTIRLDFGKDSVRRFCETEGRHLYLLELDKTVAAFHSDEFVDLHVQPVGEKVREL